MHSNFWLAAGLTCLGLVVGCGDDDTTGGGGTGASGTGANGGEGGTPSAGGEGGVPSTGGMPGEGGAGGEPPVMCEDSPNDTACVTCGKDSCCQQFTDCSANASCSACLACTQTAPNPIDCLGVDGDCDVSDPDTAAMFACANENCNAECLGGSVCEPAKGDDACFTCVKSDSAKDGCCTELEACASDVECIQCLGCFQTAKNPMDCVGAGCQLADAETGAFLICAQQNCGEGICL